MRRSTDLSVWNPGAYGADVYARFAAAYAPARPGALLAVGLNPGKYGMAQTGLPFTDCATAQAVLPATRFPQPAPGLAPRSLLPHLLAYRRERSATSWYAFLHAAFGGGAVPDAARRANEVAWDADAVARGWRDVVVGVPCPLLFLQRDGTNVTPAQTPLARRPDVQEARVAAIARCIEAAKPRGVVFLGADVARVGTATAIDAVGEDRVLAVDHPVARGPGRHGPAWWAATVAERLRAVPWGLPRGAA